MARVLKSKPVWALDIGASAIKGVQMEAADGQPRILVADILPLEGDPVRSDSPGRDRRVWRGLQEFQAKYNLRRQRVIIGLPGPIFFIRPFNLVPVGERSAEELVRFEIEQHIPFGLDAILWDYDLFGAKRSGGERQGLLFAMKKEVFNNYLLSLSAAGIEPVQVQAAPLALYNFVRHELAPAETTLVADIGAASTDLLLIMGDRYAVRSINLGADSLTQTLQRAFAPREVPRDDAEVIKLHLPKLSRRGEVAELMQPALRGFVGELRNAVDHLCRENKVPCDKLVLVGGGAATYGLSAVVREQLNARVVTPAGLGKVTVDESADAAYVNANLPSLATAIGLGLQMTGWASSRVNMVGATLLRRRGQEMARRLAASVLAACFLLTLAFGTFSTIRKGVLQRGTDELSEVRAPLALRRKRFRELTEPGASEKTLQSFRDMARGRAIWLKLVDKVARMLPENESRIAEERKFWVKRIALTARPGQPGVFDGVIECGWIARNDGSDTAFADTTLVVPLTKGDDPHVVYRDARWVESGKAASLYESGGGGRFCILKLAFTAEWKGDATP